MDGLLFNHHFISSSMLHCSIICIQEHWLWAYQTETSFDRVLPQWKCHARASDEYNHIPPGPNTRGHGGVAIIWKEYLDPHIKRLNEGNERIIAIIIEVPGISPICLICCYLPSGTSKQSVESYAEDIAVLQELRVKYSKHNLVIAGDLNADIFARRGKKEEILSSFIKETNLTNLNAPISDQPTYKNTALQHSSHLDYFLTDAKNAWGNTEIISNEEEAGCLNNSSHMPITTRLTYTPASNLSKKRKSPILNKRINWDKINIPRYQDTLIYELSKTDFSTTDVNESLSAFTMALNTAVSKAHEGKRSKGNKNNRGKPKVWSEAIKEASQKSKLAFWQWKESGRPPLPHSTTVRKCQASKHLRSVQRKEAAKQRHDFLAKVMEASERDKKLFHKLIKANRGTTGVQIILKSGDQLVHDEGDQTELWSNYFEKLASKQNYTGIENDYKLVDQIRWACKADTEEAQCYTPTEVEQIIKRLNRNKSPDIEGVTAEHLIHATIEPITILTGIINQILKTGNCPKSCKDGFKIPIPKAGKDPQHLTNYRGITITSLIGKVVEHALQDITGPLLRKEASHLQFGFTTGLSPTMASLCLTEAIASAKSDRKELHVAALDVQKAFDVVNHGKLKYKLFTEGVKGSTWCLLDSLYSDICEKVRWGGQFSREYGVHQGVRQGGVMSTSLYKLFINQLLLNLEYSGSGLHLGPIFIGSPTCADDQLLLADNSVDLQVMITACNDYAVNHQYTLHPEKSTVTTIFPKKDAIDQKWYMGGNKVTYSPTFTHLGLDWSEGKLGPNVDSRIKTARKTVYALMGTGLHGQNGLSPAIANHVIKIYVIPRLLYGLEATVLTKKQREELSTYHRNLLRIIQGLPKSTANEAIFILMGELPIEAELDIRILKMFGAICRADSNSTLKKMAHRQIAIDNKHSWFHQILLLGEKYSISRSLVVDTPWRKSTWNSYIENAVRSHWKQLLFEKTMTKSSLKMINSHNLMALKPHNLWYSCAKDPRMVPAAVIRAKLISNTYWVQQRRAKVNKNNPDPTCMLCKEESEDVTHMLLKCKSTLQIRQPRLRKLKDYKFIPDNARDLLNGPTSNTDSIIGLRINYLITDLCQRLHREREKLLQQQLNSAT